MDGVEKVKESRIELLIKFTKRLERWQNGILAYFVQKVTSALSEGLNNKISRIKKRAYGYRDIIKDLDYIKSLILKLGNLKEKEARV